MAADNEHRLLSKVIKEREIVPVLQRGITDVWFLDDENRRVWSFVRKHYSEYSEVPTATTVKDTGQSEEPDVRVSKTNFFMPTPETQWIFDKFNWVIQNINLF